MVWFGMTCGFIIAAAHVGEWDFVGLQSLTCAGTLVTLKLVNKLTGG